MILGIGSDLVDIRRVERAIARAPERFIARIFTAGEQALAAARAHPRLQASTLAKRWAAKEATVKALGTGFRDGISWHDIEVVTLDNGRPDLHLHGAARERWHAMLPPGLIGRLDVSLSDEYPYAQAWVVLSAHSPTET